MIEISILVIKEKIIKNARKIKNYSKNYSLRTDIVIVGCVNMPKSKTLELKKRVGGLSRHNASLHRPGWVSGPNGLFAFRNLYKNGKIYTDYFVKSGGII